MVCLYAVGLILYHYYKHTRSKLHMLFESQNGNLQPPSPPLLPSVVAAHNLQLEQLVTEKPLCFFYLWMRRKLRSLHTYHVVMLSSCKDVSKK